MSVRSSDEASQDVLVRPAPVADARLAYGPGPGQFGDLRLPPGAGPHRLVIVLHGGFWRAAYDLAHSGHLCAALAAAGLATWSLEYRRVGQPGGGWPGTVHDVALGAAFVGELARRYPLAARGVVVLGHSAGGHLALWLAAHAGRPIDAAAAVPVRLDLAGVVALAGVTDLRSAAQARLGRGAVQDFLGGEPDVHPERYAAASPLERLPLGCRQVLVHGAEDATVPIEQSERYCAAAQAHGDAARMVRLPGTGHFEVIDPASAAWPAVREAVTSLVEA